MSVTSLYAKTPTSDKNVGLKSLVKYFHICNHTGAEYQKVCLWFPINVENRIYIIELSMKVNNAVSTVAQHNFI